MSYSWDAEIINNMVTWFEVYQVNKAKSTLINFFDKAERKFDIVQLEVKRVDDLVSQKIFESTTDVEENTEIVNMLSKYLNETSPVPDF